MQDETITDFAVSLNQRSYLFDVLLKSFKALEILDQYDKNMLFHITGRISLLKYRFLLKLFFQKRWSELTFEVNQLVKEAGGSNGQ